ncbi:MAG TPA: zinc dependent phospholipase C family protein [Candidatus Binataceae bacterium]|nr:zinc dependent phospholipase C family protein [Candidatus Binataceae bacterium]
MIIAAAIGFVIAFVLFNPEPALAWGPVTHIAMGVQALAAMAPEHPLQAVLESLPEVFLYGSLAPDIVQGRRLQSRLRRHSHNWETGVGLLSSAHGQAEVAFAYGYLAHLAADVVAHNFFLPARFVGHFDQGIASHIYNEACFDSLYDSEYRDLLLRLLELDFRPLDVILKRAIDSPLISFGAHRRIFEGGLKRIRQWHRVIRATGGHARILPDEAELFGRASCGAVAEALDEAGAAPCCRFDPMGAEAIRNALSARRSLQRLTKIGPQARETAHELGASMLSDMMAHLRQTPFGHG